VNFTIGEQSPAFMQWGWRLPFLFSAALIGIGLYMRLNIEETPVFAEEKCRRMIPKARLAELLRLQRREVVLAAGSLLGRSSFGFTASTYLAAYAHTDLGYSRSVIFCVGVLGGLASMVFIADRPQLSSLNCSPPRYRYSGSGLAVSIAGVAGGAVPPLIAGPLQTTYGNWAVALMLATIGAIGLVCAYLLPETNGTALLSARRHEDAPAVS
jgi:hypothetical protein